MRIKWKKVEDERGGLVSAASTLDCAIRQLQMDRLVAITTLLEHMKTCKECAKKKACKVMLDMLKQIKERAKKHKGLFETIDFLHGVSKWYKPPKDEPSIIHELNAILKFHGVNKK